MKIYAGIIEVMRGIEAIGKDKKNASQGYNFRGIDDVYNDVHNLFAKAGIFCVSRVVDDRTEDRPSKNGGVLIYRVLSMEFDLVAEDGSKHTFGPFIGEGMDSGDKASNKAMSVAQKYFILQTFLVPTIEAKDPENDSPVVAQRQQVLPPKPVTQAQKPIAKESDIKKEFDYTMMRGALMVVLQGVSLEKEAQIAYAKKHWGIESLKAASDEVIADLYKRICK